MHLGLTNRFILADSFFFATKLFSLSHSIASEFEMKFVGEFKDFSFENKNSVFLNKHTNSRQFLPPEAVFLVICDPFMNEL